MRESSVIRGPVRIADLGNECAKPVVLNQGPDQNLRGLGQACIFWKSFPGDCDVRLVPPTINHESEQEDKKSCPIMLALFLYHEDVAEAVDA